MGTDTTCIGLSACGGPCDESCPGNRETDGDKSITAFVWANGLIQFGVTVPDGALPVLKGPEKAVRDIIDVLAVHCWDNVSLKIGDVATAKNDDDALEAVRRFSAEAWGRLSKAHIYS